MKLNVQTNFTLSLSVMFSSAALLIRLRASSFQGGRRAVATVISGNKTSKWVGPHPGLSVTILSQSVSSLSPVCLQFVASLTWSDLILNVCVSRLVRERLKVEVEKMKSDFSGFRPALLVLQVHSSSLFPVDDVLYCFYWRQLPQKTSSSSSSSSSDLWQQRAASPAVVWFWWCRRKKNEPLIFRNKSITVSS